MHERVITHWISSLCFPGKMREEGRSPRLLAQSDISPGRTDVTRCWPEIEVKDYELIPVISLNRVRMAN